ncbi:methylated-DNA-[protein]-cysteine S-methyltransferase [Knoellia remsis]|uniref:Methylated-DNA--protein-cysteine methyltransferase n=1 Tax=Knoellia remsis TaxID=407159 RepID=A0A2T0TXB3_9MICO|nr:methylated-DNA--[protein]-cysteine S-methyltransferase [Knoellia remsis]PRY50270.1 methylated-DNA-[protein]-cysteine S-methyltransferase [Knoellia remsis]
MGVMTSTARRHTTLATDLGDLLAVADGDALVGLYFPGHWHPPADGTIGAPVSPTGDPVFETTRSELAEYLRGDRTTFTVATATAGDAFSERVWDHLATIPYGTTTTYGTIARELGGPGLAQRVGQAVGRNPVSIVIPCHRVVGADGSLTGYAGGLERKARLLALEEPREVAESRLF